MSDQPSSSAGKKQRILIVDDYETMRAGVIRIVGGDPRWEVCGEAVNGQEAVRKVLELQPDLVVLDISMPLMNGIQAAGEIRRLAPKTKIVVLTMYSTPFIRDEVLRGGADACVSKDSVAVDLPKAIESLLNPSS